MADLEYNHIPRTEKAPLLGYLLHLVTYSRGMDMFGCSDTSLQTNPKHWLPDLSSSKRRSRENSALRAFSSHVDSKSSLIWEDTPVLPFCLSASSTQTDNHDCRHSAPWTLLLRPVTQKNEKQANRNRGVILNLDQTILTHLQKRGEIRTFLTYLRPLPWQHFLLGKCVLLRLKTTWLAHEHQQLLTSWGQRWNMYLLLPSSFCDHISAAGKCNRPQSKITSQERERVMLGIS